LQPVGFEDILIFKHLESVAKLTQQDNEELKGLVQLLAGRFEHIADDEAYTYTHTYMFRYKPTCQDLCLNSMLESCQTYADLMEHKVGFSVALPQVAECIGQLHLMISAAPPLSVEQEEKLSVAFRDLQKNPKASKVLVAPAMVSMCSSVSELLRCSAADRRTAAAFVVVKEQLGKLGDDLAVQKVQGCRMASLTNVARALKPLYLKHKAARATMSARFQADRAADVRELDDLYLQKVVKLRVMQVSQFWESLDVPLSLLTKAMVNKTNSVEDCAITAAFASAPLSASMSSSASLGLDLLMSQEMLDFHNNLVLSMKSFKVALEELHTMSKDSKSWEVTEPRLAIFSRASSALVAMSEKDDCKILGGAAVVWPQRAGDTKKTFEEWLTTNVESYVEKVLAAKLAAITKVVTTGLRKPKQIFEFTVKAPWPSLELCTLVEAIVRDNKKSIL